MRFLVDSYSQLEKCANLVLFFVCFHFFLVSWLCNLDIFKNYVDFTLEMCFPFIEVFFIISLCLTNTHPFWLSKGCVFFYWHY